MKKDNKYVSPVGKHVCLQLNDKTLGAGIVLHQSAHLITLMCVDKQGNRGQVQWFGWGPGMVMFEVSSNMSVDK